ncbi:MAG TPA: hypothetical protein VF337_09905 [Candidatus Limnocylindrales bacterium]
MSERTREEILRDLVSLAGPVAPLEAELREFGWDSDEPLVVLTAADAIGALDRFIRDEVTASEIAAWAEALEARDDVGFEPASESTLKDLIFTGLSHPELNGELTRDSARLWKSRLSDGR